MKKHTKIIAVGILLLTLAMSLSAKPAEKPITDQEAVKLIADWPAVYNWFEERGKKIEAQGDAGIPTALFLEKDFIAFLQKRGWTPERFQYVSGTVFSLLMIAAVERENPDMSKQFDDAIAQIKASAMTPAQKEENIKAINDAKASMLAVSTDKDVNQDELAIVRKHYDEFMKMSEEMGED